MSTAVSRVLACLLEKDVDFHLLPVDMTKRQHKSPDFLKLQPFGQVPAFQTSYPLRAICRYVCDKYSERGNKRLLGLGLLERASIEQWLEAESQSFNLPSSTVVFQLAFAPRMNLSRTRRR
ncbi:Glutathione S-transferase PARB [Acorus calamus]|uniref:glutathione transferase n=1 Tax=Acorus calamus TaxID=4465 RepID=A0AAV9DP21_ACOCL|nr:Glutathione S-transferase PARB [Acorus calamus]